MTGVPSWLTDLNNSIQSTVDYITNNNYLEYAVSSGFGDVPIAAYGMVIIVLSTLTYATVVDPKNITSVSNVAYNAVKSIPGLTGTDAAEIDKQFAKEKELEQKEEEKEREKDEAEYKSITAEEEKEKKENDKLKEEAKEEEKDDEYKRDRKKKRRDEYDDDDEDDDEDFLRSRGGKGIKGTKGSLKIPPSNKISKRSIKKRRKIN
jgi:uncharacterized membrane protein YukC